MCFRLRVIRIISFKHKLLKALEENLIIYPHTNNRSNPKTKIITNKGQKMGCGVDVNKAANAVMNKLVMSFMW